MFLSATVLILICNCTFVTKVIEVGTSLSLTSQPLDHITSHVHQNVPQETEDHRPGHNWLSVEDKEKVLWGDDILAESSRVGFVVQSLGMGEPVPRHTGTENIVFREKQKSSVAGHWGKEWTLGEAGPQLEGQAGSTMQKAFWSIESPWEFPTKMWFELASLLRVWPWEKGRGWTKEKELQSRVAGPNREARTGRPYSEAPVLGSPLGQGREIWAVRAWPFKCKVVPASARPRNSGKGSKCLQSAYE